MHRVVVEEMLSGTGFTFSDRPGFIGMARTTESGFVQRCDVFRWSNHKAADKAGIPRASLIVRLTLEGSSPEFQIPLVEWPSHSQHVRPWVDVVREFREKVLPVLGA